MLVGYGTRIFQQDLVSAGSGGGVEASAANDTIVIIGSALTGSAASTAGTISATMDVDQLYQAQEDSVSSTLALADRFTTADHIAGAGSATTGLSAHEIDSDTADASGNNSISIIDLLDRGDNLVGDQAEWVCRIVGHLQTSLVGV